MGEEVCSVRILCVGISVRNRKNGQGQRPLTPGIILDRRTAPKKIDVIGQKQGEDGDDDDQCENDDQGGLNLVLPFFPKQA